MRKFFISCPIVFTHSRTAGGTGSDLLDKVRVPKRYDVVVVVVIIIVRVVVTVFEKCLRLS